MTRHNPRSITVVDFLGPGERDKRLIRRFANELKKRDGNWHKSSRDLIELHEIIRRHSWGTHILLLGANDLPSDELAERLELIAVTHPTADIIYGDTAVALGEKTKNATPVFKPRWSPARLLHENFVGDAILVRTAFFLSIAREELYFDEWESWDFLLASLRANARVHHDPAVWTIDTRGTPSRVESGQLTRRGKAASRAKFVNDHLKRAGSSRIVRELESSKFLEIVPLRTDQLPSHSFVTLTAGASDAALNGGEPFIMTHLEAVRSHASVSMDSHVVIIGPECNPAVRQSLSEIRGYSVALVEVEGEFNFAARSNVGRQYARSEILVFTNDDFVPTRSDWLSQLLAPFEDEKVGITGATLLYDDGSVQHAGHEVIGGNFFHTHHALTPDDEGWERLVSTNREVDAVTGACLAIRRSVFDRVGGFFEGLPFNYNDVDLCMKVRSLGYHVVNVGVPVGVHYESKTRPATVLPEEMDLFFRRWPERSETSEYPF